jgi:glycosyltransferase involved in cell wall biosynthesis
MGASKPVICLDLGGPPLIVGTKAGIPVFPSTPRETYMKVGDVMTKLANNTVSVVELGRQGRLRVENDLTWRIKCEIISGYVGFVQQV